MRNHYLEMRGRYEPANVKLLIVAEVPPEGGKYFYNPSGRKTEPLFAAIMEQLGRPFADKHDGLLNLQRSGWVLVDATYEPVNQHGSKPIRNQIIERDYPKLCEDLARLTPDRSAPVLLLKANVCELLEIRLMHDGFKVLNRGVKNSLSGQRPSGSFREPFRVALEFGGHSADHLASRGMTPHSAQRCPTSVSSAPHCRLTGGRRLQPCGPSQPG